MKKQLSDLQPWECMMKRIVEERWKDNAYTQIIGTTDVLRTFPEESFDMIICHNVFEYALDMDVSKKEFKIDVIDAVLEALSIKYT